MRTAVAGPQLRFAQSPVRYGYVIPPATQDYLKRHAPFTGESTRAANGGQELYPEDMTKTVQQLINSHEPDTYDTADDDGNMWPAFGTGFYPVGIDRGALVGDWEVRE